jgi:hypothetical protein
MLLFPPCSPNEKICVYPCVTVNNKQHSRPHEPTFSLEISTPVDMARNGRIHTRLFLRQKTACLSFCSVQFIEFNLR